VGFGRSEATGPTPSAIGAKRLSQVLVVDFACGATYVSVVAEYVDVDASPTGWREAGTARGVAVFLHGLGGSRISWRPQLEALGTRRRIVAWDAPGYGVSAPIQETSFTAYAKRAGELIETVSPGAPVDLIGLSFGGMIAQYTAAEFPERIRTLTVMCTSPKFGLDGTDPESWRQARLSGLEHFGSPAAAAPTILSSLVGPRGAGVVPEAVQAMERVEMSGLLDAIATITSHDTRAILPSIEVPTLVLVGSADEETPVAYAQAIVDLMPNARLAVVDGAGHLLNLESPDAVNAALLDHWSNH
jgi:3-oxoadipate enol-lactonase